MTLSPDFGTLAGGPGCCPLDDESYHPPSHSHRLNALVFVVWLGLVSSRPLAHPVPYPQAPHDEAAPKCISGRTSYLQVRLAFHLYPQLIPPFCNTDGFGPPARVSGPSPWPWVAHLVSGLLHATHKRPYQTRFRCGSRLPAVNLATGSNSPAHSSISTPSRG